MGGGDDELCENHLQRWTLLSWSACVFAKSESLASRINHRHLRSYHHFIAFLYLLFPLPCVCVCLLVLKRKKMAKVVFQFFLSCPFASFSSSYVNSSISAQNTIIKWVNLVFFLLLCLLLSRETIVTGICDGKCDSQQQKQRMPAIQGKLSSSFGLSPCAVYGLFLLSFSKCILKYLDFKKTIFRTMCSHTLSRKHPLPCVFSLRRPAFSTWTSFFGIAKKERRNPRSTDKKTRKTIKRNKKVSWNEKPSKPIFRIRKAFIVRIVPPAVF